MYLVNYVFAIDNEPVILLCNYFITIISFSKKIIVISTIIINANLLVYIHLIKE